MRGGVKITFIFVFLVAAAFFFNSCSARATNDRFKDDIKFLVNSKMSFHADPEQHIKDAIRSRASKHEITLDDDAIEVKVAETKFNPLGRMGGAVRMTSVRVKVTYERQILPLFKKTFVIVQQGKSSNI